MTSLTSFLKLAASTGTALAVSASLAGAQVAGNVATDSRWAPFLGCWSPAEAPVVSLSGSGTSASVVCVTPSASGGVDVSSIVNGRVTAKERVDATGAQIAKAVDGCQGWEQATWSDDGSRVLLRSELRCGDNVTRKGTGVFAISPKGEWVDVEGVDVMGSTGVRVMRFRDAGANDATLRVAQAAAVGDSVSVATGGQAGFATRTVRTAASAAISPDDVLNVARNVDGPVAEAWLTEMIQPPRTDGSLLDAWLGATSRQPFTIDGRTLVRLADAGLSPRMIDLLVALAYPSTFAVNQAGGPNGSGTKVIAGQGPAGPRGVNAWGLGSSLNCSMFDDRYRPLGYYDSAFYNQGCYSRYDRAYGRYGYSPYGYGYGSNYYWGQQPIVIITRGSDNDPAVQAVRGRAVRGSGYTRESGAPSGTSRPSGSTPSGSGAAGAKTPTESSGGGASAPAARTAKPKGGGSQ
jgi:hypothetical protein